jgi:16S rRNA (cytosine967-C5)-methyltransferase
MPDNARNAALYALERCRRGGAWSPAAIDGAAEKFALDRRDTAFVSRLTLCALENFALCDHYIGAYCTLPVKRLEPAVLDILRLGVCQILFMDRVPDSAAVDTGVQLCRDAGYARAAGLVNAVLRRVAENKADLPAVPGAGTAKYLAVRYSHPEWLAQRLIKEHGYGFTESFFAADNSPAELCVQTNTLKCAAAELAGHLTDAGISCRAHPWAEDALLVENPGNVEKLPGFAEGLFYVQDPAAAFTAATLGLQSGMRVLDVCAAPGGKSFAAAIRMRNKGEIVARDIHEKKLGLISRGAKRLGIDIISTESRDARESGGGDFDAVIVDAPCSGMGVIGKKPEIRGKSEKEIAGLPEIQLAILKSASECVRPGGALLYSTCTVLTQENEAVAAAFLAENGDFAAEGFQVRDKRPEGMYTFWPQTDETDGFFICLMRRKN